MGKPQAEENFSKMLFRYLTIKLIFSRLLVRFWNTVTIRHFCRNYIFSNYVDIEREYIYVRQKTYYYENTEHPHFNSSITCLIFVIYSYAKNKLDMDSTMLFRRDELNRCIFYLELILINAIKSN